MLTSTTPRIAFDDAGDGGPALLCLPGWCARRTVFRPLLAPVARRRRILSLDWRGHGGSDAPPDPATTEQLVEDALAVIEASGAAQVVPVGLAHAGWVAIELRRRLGAVRVPGIVLLDWMVLGAPPGFLEALGGLQKPDTYEPVRAGLFAKWTTGVQIEALDAHIAEMAAFGFETWARAGREIAAQFARWSSPAAALASLAPACDVLHLYAQPADEAFLTAQREYAAAHPWFRVHRLQARSHFPMFEVPGEVAAVLDDFVASLGK